MLTQRKNMEEFLNSLSNSAVLLTASSVFIIFGLTRYFSNQREIKAANQIMRMQYDKASQQNVEDLLNQFKGSQEKERIIREVRYVRTQLGHEGLKIGHLAWIVKKIQEGVPEKGDIPLFRSQ